MKDEKKRYGMVCLVGAGPGAPGLITVRGRELLKACDAVVYDHLASQELLSETREDCERIYVGKQAGRHYMKQGEINGLLVRLAEQGKRVVRLKGGDPFVFGRGGEEILALKEAGISWEIVPGVTSAVAVPECAGIPVTHRDLSRSFHVMTAHGKEGEEDCLDFSQLASMTGTLVFLMGLGRLEKLAQELVEAGKSSSCPAAVIENGSLPGQRTVRGTLADIAGKAKEANLRTPAVIVVGETAGVDLSGLPERSALPVVGVTGTGLFCEKMEKELQRYGILTRRIGGLSIRCRLEEEKEQLYGRLKDYTVLAFTSANGAELFLEGLLNQGMDARALSHMRIGAVGEGTAQALRQRGLRADWIPRQYTTADLARLLAARCGKEDQVLIPRSADGSRELNRILDEARVVYRDVPLYETEGKPVDVSLLAGINCMIFGSASGVEAFFKGCGEERGKLALEKTAAAAIGPYTSAALKKRGCAARLEPEIHTITETARMVKDFLRIS